MYIKCEATEGAKTHENETMWREGLRVSITTANTRNHRIVGKCPGYVGNETKGDRIYMQ